MNNGPADEMDLSHAPAVDEENSYASTLAENVPDIWSSLSWGMGTLQEAANAGSAAISETWASTEGSRHQIAANVTQTVGVAKETASHSLCHVGEKLEQITPMIQPGLAQARTKIFGQRPQNAVFGVPLGAFGGGAPIFLEEARTAIEQHINTAGSVRFLFRSLHEADAREACDGAAEFQMMIDEGEEVDFTGCSAVLILSLLISYLWSLPRPILATNGVLDATAREMRSTGTLSVMTFAEAWGELRASNPSEESSTGQEDEQCLQTRDVVLHQVLAPVKLLKSTGNAEEAHDYCLMLAPAVFHLDTASNVLHSLQMVNAEAALFVLAEMV